MVVAETEKPGPVASLSATSNKNRATDLRVPNHEGTVRLKAVEAGSMVNIVVEPGSPFMNCGIKDWTSLSVSLAIDIVQDESV